jgi:uncharacterized membrane protein YgdD (TMEM256/DUF423 family)
MRFAPAGAVSALIAVLAGAFGAHALRDRLSPELLQSFETGARYQMYHALALLVAGRGKGPGGPRGGTRLACWLFLVGTVLFSGSLYALSLTGVRAWGAVTPVGGLCFLAGWAALARALWRER